MSKKYSSHSSLQDSLMKGIDVLANNVASTLGPRGRNVILHKKDFNPVITKDGVTVAKFVELEDPFQNAGVQILKQASEETNNSAGDGTTTATVLARAIFKHAQKYIAAGSSPNELKKGIDKAVKLIAEEIEAQSRPIMSKEDIAHVATISANGDEAIGELIATAVDKVGKDGSITIEEARSLETSLEVIEGFKFDSGYIAGAFVTDERRAIMRHEEPYMLVTDALIESVDDILPVLELVARESKPLVIVAENIEGQALAALIMNAMRGTMKVAAIKAPRYGEERKNILDDLAISVGATYVSRVSGMKLRDIKLEHLGVAKTVEASKYFTTVVGGSCDYDEVEKRIETLKLEAAETESLQEAELTQERITRLSSGVAVVYVGGSTEVEMVERKHRIEDALAAVLSAQEEGVVLGGGVTLLRSSQALEEEDVEANSDNAAQRFGFEIIKEAVEEPIRQMAMNAGESPDLIVEIVRNGQRGEGYDFRTGRPVDMLEAGIIDPAKVTRSALQNAASAASTLINTQFAIIEV